MRAKLIYLAASLSAVLLLYVAVPQKPAAELSAPTQQQTEAVPFSGDVSAEAAVLIEAESGKILWERNSDRRLPMASTTKIMTALLTLSQPDLDAVFTVDSGAIRVEGSSMGLREGDSASLYALAAGMLTVSGNDGANAAAVRIAGSVPKFAALMNRKAAEIGMKNTHFVTPSGLDDPEHYSTAYDMALLGAEAVRSELFVQICSARSTAAEYGNPPYCRILANSNRLLRSCEGCIGIKTGFTKKSGRCLVTAVRRDGITLVCVTLNAPDDWNDHQKLYDYGFTAVEKIRLVPEAAEYTVNVAGTGQQVRLIPRGEASGVVVKGDGEQITQRAAVPKFVFAPVVQGQEIGEIQYIYHGRVIEKQTLIAAYDLREPPSRNFWEKLLLFLGVGEE